MKKILLLASIFIACSDSDKKTSEDSEPKYRTVFFGDAHVLDRESMWGEDQYIKIRVMIDTLSSHMFYNKDSWRELSKISSSRYPMIDSQSKYTMDDYPYYALYRLHGHKDPLITSEFANELSVNQVARIADFSRQEKITGRHLDMAIGIANISDSERGKYWADMDAVNESGEKVKLLEYYIDEQMQVPYDWGMNN